MHAWEQLFVGRTAEIQVIQDAWVRAKGREPSVVLLIGESRLGKTRVVQEFYTLLSRSEDNRGYWPDWLSHSRGSLSINPEFFAGKPNGTGLPWLWWGLRWTRPDLRNADESRHCAALDDLHHLEPHLSSVLRKAEERDAMLKVGMTGANTALSLLPMVGFLSGLKDVIESVRAYGQVRSAKEREAAQVSELREKTSRDAVSNVFDLISSMLATDVVEAGGLPTILVLDDVQWIDRESAHLLIRLLRAAREGKWPLLVLATHWEQEWLQQESEPLPPNASAQPRTFSQVLRTLAMTPGRDYSSLILPPLDGLDVIVQSALPGLSPAQQSLMVEKAGGNPGLLYEIILYYRNNPRHFVERNPACALSARSEMDLRERMFSLHTLIQERFAALGETMREVVGVGAYQGFRFSEELTVKTCRRLFITRGNSPDTVEPAIKAAQSPHAIIQTVARDTSEFRQFAFYEVALEYFNSSESEALAARNCLTELLHQRVVPAVFDKMPVAEQEACARLALREFRLQDPPTAESQVAMMDAGAALVFAMSEAERPEPLRDAWSEWRGGLGGDPQYVADHLDLRRLRAMISVAARLSDMRFAEVLAKVFLQRARDGTAHDSYENLTTLVDALETAGDIAMDQGQLDTATTLYEEGIAVCRRIRPEGHSPSGADRRLCDLLFRQTEARRRTEELDAAEAAGREALELAREAAQKDSTSENLEFLATALNNLAYVFRRRDQVAVAVAFADEALALSRRRVEEHGRSKDAFHMLHAFLGNRASLETSLGNTGKALDYAREGVVLARQIVREHGPSEFRLRRLATSLAQVQRLCLTREEYDETQLLGEESLALCSAVVRDYGPAQGRLIDLGISHNNLGQSLAKNDRPEEAEKELRKALEILAPSPDATLHQLEQRSTALCNLGDLLAEQERFSEAEQLLRESVGIDRRIIRDYGSSSERLIELMQSVSRLGPLLQDLGRTVDAGRWYDKRLRLCRRLVTTHGTSTRNLTLLGLALMDFAGFLEKQRESDAALPLALECVQILKQVQAELPNETRPRLMLAVALHLLGDLLHLDCDRTEAIKAHLDAIQAYRDYLKGEQNPQPGVRTKQIVLLTRTAKHLELMRESKLAGGLLFEASNLSESLVAKAGQHEMTTYIRAETAKNLAEFLLSAGQRDQAVALFRQSLAFAQQIVRDFGPSCGRAGNVEDARQRLDEVLFHGRPDTRGEQLPRSSQSPQ